MPKKKWKIEIPDDALKDVPEEDREQLKKEITALFENREPGEIGEPIQELPEGSLNCPKCGADLEAGPTFSLPEGEVTQIFFCLECDDDFIGQPLN
jgi:hypothetical protein